MAWTIEKALDFNEVLDSHLFESQKGNSIKIKMMCDSWANLKCSLHDVQHKRNSR